VDARGNVQDQVLVADVPAGRRVGQQQVLADQEWALRLHRPNGGVPYGIALAAAALLIYPDTPWMQLG
jgi:prepilin peptidase CpaA